jgi:group II intron reverse transcriptase/maturase
MDVEFLEYAFKQLRRKSAAGIDKVTWRDYNSNLRENLEALHERLVRKHYRAQPAKRSYIPKDDKEKRALSIWCLEDKIVQSSVGLIMSAVYEEDFYDLSFGFRKGKSCHQALKYLDRAYFDNHINWIIDADLRQFFDTIDHKRLVEVVKKRINDGTIIQLIGKWLKVGVLEAEGQLIKGERGTPQGAVISPLLANIYLHEVLDKWYTETVMPCMKARTFIVRYADDFVIGCESKYDADRLMEVLIKRFSKYGLIIHPEKSKLVKMSRPRRNEPKDKGNESFDFLGFTHYLGKSRQGSWVLKKKTRTGKVRAFLRNIKDYCKSNRHKPLEEQHQKITQKLRGHYNYFGVRFNSRALGSVYDKTKKIWYKWLERRGHRSKMNWDKMNKILEIYPLPVPRISVEV